MANVLGRIQGFAAAALVLGISVGAGAKWAHTGTPSASFTAHASMVGAKLNFTGTTNSVTVGEEGEAIAVSVQLATLSTKMDLRDKHVRQTLETDKYPMAKLVVPRGKLTFPDAENPKAGGTVNGALTLHGITKPHRFKYHAQSNGATVHVTGEMEIELKEFDIVPHKYPGTKVQENVEIAVEFDLKNAN